MLKATTHSAQEQLVRSMSTMENDIMTPRHQLTTFQFMAPPRSSLQTSQTKVRRCCFLMPSLTPMACILNLPSSPHNNSNFFYILHPNIHFSTAGVLRQRVGVRHTLARP